MCEQLDLDACYYYIRATLKLIRLDNKAIKYIQYCSIVIRVLELFCILSIKYKIA